MKKLIRDPELDELVRELNQSDTSASITKQPDEIPTYLQEGNPLEQLLVEVAQRGASDLLIVAGSPPVFRVGGALVHAQ